MRPSVAEASWPVVDPSLLVTEPSPAWCRCRARSAPGWRSSPDISEEDLRELALAEDGVVRSLAGREIAKVIIRAPKLVSIVPADRLDFSPLSTSDWVLLQNLGWLGSGSVSETRTLLCCGMRRRRRRGRGPMIGIGG